MKIAIPAEERSMETNVCQSFGRTPYYLIYDTGSKEGSFVENTAAASQGGAGIKAAQIIVDSGANALLTPRCGENAAEVIKAAGIKIYKTVDDSIKDTIEGFTGGKLAELSEIHAGFHNHGEK